MQFLYRSTVKNDKVVVFVALTPEDDDKPRYIDIEKASKGKFPFVLCVKCMDGIEQADISHIAKHAPGSTGTSLLILFYRTNDEGLNMQCKQNYITASEAKTAFDVLILIARRENFLLARNYFMDLMELPRGTYPVDDGRTSYN